MLWYNTETQRVEDTRDCMPDVDTKPPPPNHATEQISMPDEYLACYYCLVNQATSRPSDGNPPSCHGCREKNVALREMAAENKRLGIGTVSGGG